MQIKIPAESSLLSHVQFLRELLDNDVVEAMAWTGTRDMVADGLTKGTVDRTALQQAMAGDVYVRHEFKLWRSPLATRACNLPPETTALVTYRFDESKSEGARSSESLCDTLTGCSS